MEDLNDIYFFASVVQYGGFSAAARAIGVEKTRLSRRIAALEKRLGVRLLQRTTRALALTEAGQRFFERCVATVEEAQAAYDSVAELRREPAGFVRLSSPVLLTQRCLAHALPSYMTIHPKVCLAPGKEHLEVALSGRSAGKIPVTAKPDGTTKALRALS